MDEFLGFVVLTGPLFPILIWLVISILLVTFIVKPTGTGMRRAIIKFLVFSIIVMLPFADEIVGRIYFNSVCKTDAGFKVHQTVLLPEEYWDENGNLNIFNEQGYLDHSFWVTMIDESEGSVERYSKIFKIDKRNRKVVYRDGRILLGEITTFRYWGGWVRQSFSPSNTANSCQFMSASDFSRKFYGGLFEQAALIKQGG